MVNHTIQSGELKWDIIKKNGEIQVIINQEKFAKLPINVFPNEKEAIDTAKYNIVNELIKELNINSFGIRNGICRPPDTSRNKPRFSIS